MEQNYATPSSARTNKKRLALFAGAVVLIAGAVMGVLAFLHRDDDDEGPQTVYDSTAFFIRETEKTGSKYALFNKNGDKLTDFIFNFASSFVNGYALVRNGDNQYGVINQDGNMTIEFGKYEDLSTRGGLFENEQDDGKRTLLSGDGRELQTGYEKYVEAYGAPYVVIETEENKYKLFNATSEELLSFESAGRPVFSTFDKKVASALHYDGHIVLLNNKTLKTITDQNAEPAYTLAAFSNDTKTAVFSAKSGEATSRAVYNDGNFKEYGNACQTIELTDEDKEIPGRKYLSCRTADGDFLMRNGEATDINIDDGDLKTAVFDENHYIRYNSKDKKATIYVDGKDKTTVDADTVPTINGKAYFISNNAAKTQELFDVDGNSLRKIEDSTRSTVYGLDKHDNIIVYDASQDSDSRCYIVRKNGDEISGKYSTISRHGDYYTAIRSGAKTADLLDKDGKKIVSGNYSNFEFYKSNTIVFGKKDDKHLDLIDVKGRGVRTELEGSVSVDSNNYFKLTTDAGTSFYTKKGKLIYEQGK